MSCISPLYFLNCEHIITLRTDAIAAVTFFGEGAPDQFETFVVGFVTLFRVAAGEPFFSDTFPMRQSDGTTNYGAVLFFISYVLLVNWTLLQACVAVLVDNFISSSAQSQVKEQALVNEERKSRLVIKSSLDPLLARLIIGYRTILVTDL